MDRSCSVSVGFALLAGLATPLWSQASGAATRIDSRCSAYAPEPGLGEAVIWMNDQGQARVSSGAPRPAEMQQLLTGDFTLVIAQTQGASEREWIEYVLSLAAPPAGGPTRVMLTGKGRYMGTRTGGGALKRERHMDSVTTVTVTADTQSGGLALELDWLSSFLHVLQVWPDGRFRGVWSTGLSIGIEVKTPWGSVLETPAGYFCAWPSARRAP